jgi:hypothetical protein
MGGLKTVDERDDTRITRLTAAEKSAWEARLKTIAEKWVENFEKQGLPYREMLKDYLSKGS